MNTLAIKPLSPLQKAYLVGRTNAFPLGHTSMQDFRAFAGTVNADNLHQSILRLTQKYTALRTMIDATTLTQAVSCDTYEHFECINLTLLRYPEATNALESLRAYYANYMHALDKPPWFIWLIQLPANATYSSVVFTSFDGLILDGYSITRLLSELFSAQPIDDYQQTQTILAQDKTPFFSHNAKHEHFWFNKLASVQTPTPLPWNKDLETIFTPSYKRQGIVIDKSIWQKISMLAAKHRLLPNSVLTTIIFDALLILTDNRPLTISLPISHSALLNTIGNHSSFIVLTYPHQPSVTFWQRAQTLQKDILESMGHTAFSGLEIAKHLIKKMSRLITLPIALTNGLSWGLPLKSTELAYTSGITHTPQLALDIRLTLSVNADLVIDCDYVEQALSATVITKFLRILNQHLTQFPTEDIFAPVIVAQTESKDRPPSSERAQSPAFVVEDYLKKIQHHLFSNALDKTALVFGNTRISYSMLGQQVTKLMTKFEQLAIKPGSVVAICLPKSPEYIYTALACALRGIIWVPIDMDAPEARIRYLLDNCCATNAVSLEPITGLNTIDIQTVLSTNLVATTIPESQYAINLSAAYYLYTSGSTGTPKCVVLNNLATANVLETTIAQWQITQNDVFMAATPFYHDMSVFDLFAALAVGASLVVPTQAEIKDAVAWARLVEAEQITLWCSVPAIVDMLLTCAQAGQLNSLRLIAQGGDYIKPTIIQKLRHLLPKARLISLGGPTETTIWSIWHEIGQHDIEMIPYGRALKYNQYYILDAQHQHCPNNVVGTICMAGINLSNGYLVAGKLHQNDFIHIPDPKGDIQRMFKSSDQGYVRDDGTIIFAGREASYLKIRGVRISAIEVEQALAKSALIKGSIVIASMNPIYDEHELVAIYTTHANQATLNIQQVRHFLQTQLPATHIPSRWLPIAQFPLTRNGKVDRNALKTFAQETLYKHYANQSKTVPNQKSSEETIVNLLRHSG